MSIPMIRQTILRAGPGGSREGRSCLVGHGTLALGAALFSMGCQVSDAPPHFAVRDSSGIMIVENTRPAWEPGHAWIVEHTPTLEIGAMDAPDEYQFSDIAAVWLNNEGKLVVGERMGSQIRMYDSAGRFERAFGREGEGPGEFRHLTALVPYRGDSIVAWDTQLKRLSVFDADGVLGRTQAISLEQIQGGEGSRSWGLSDSFWGTFPDGSFAFSPLMILRYDLLPTFRRPVVRVSAEGDSLGLPGVLVVTDLRGAEVPFPRLGTIAVHGAKIYSGLGERFELEVRAADGTPESIIRLPGYSRPVDEAALQTFLEWYRDRLSIPQMGRTEEQVERELAGVRFPATFPPYSALVVDAERHLWVEEYRAYENPGSAGWQVFDPSGRWLGPVETPDDFLVHQIGEDFVLGVWTDEVDVPYVRLFPLRGRVN